MGFVVESKGKRLRFFAQPFGFLVAGAIRRDYLRIPSCAMIVLYRSMSTFIR